MSPGKRANPTQGGTPPYVYNSTALGGARMWKKPPGWGETGVIKVWGPDPNTSLCFLIF